MKFSYHATTDAEQVVSGEIESDSLADAILKLQSEGFEVHSIQLKTTARPSPSLSAATTEKLDAALKQNTPLVDRLQAITLELPAGASRRELIQVTESLRQGASIQSLVDSHSSWAPLLIGATLDAEGDNVAFRDSMDRLLQSHEERSSFWKVLIYPIAILGLALLVLLMLGWFVIPSFSQMFDEFGLRLPVPTQLTLGFSNRLVAHPIATLLLSLVAIAAPIGLVWGWRQFRLTTRIFGYVPIKDRPQGLAELTSQTANFLSAGLPLDEALRLVRYEREPFYEDAARTLVRHLRMKTRPPVGFLAAQRVVRVRVF